MSSVLYEISHNDQVATIILNKPETYNAFDLTSIDILTKYLKKIHKNHKIKLLIIRSTGKHFSSGADLNWMKDSIYYSKQQNFKDAHKLGMMLKLLHGLNKPVMVLVHGNVYGGAIGIVACGDLVIAAKNSKFCFSEVKFGLAPAIISPFVLQVMPISFAKYSMLSSKIFKVLDACKFGLVHEVVDKNETENMVAKNIDNILSLSHAGLLATKKLLRQIQKPISLRNLNFCAKIIAELRVGKDAQQRISKFLKL